MAAERNEDDSSLIAICLAALHKHLHRDTEGVPQHTCHREERQHTGVKSEIERPFGDRENTSLTIHSFLPSFDDLETIFGLISPDKGVRSQSQSLDHQNVGRSS